MLLQVEPDVLTAEYRAQVLEQIDTAIAVGVLGLSVLIFLLGVIVVRRL